MRRLAVALFVLTAAGCGGGSPDRPALAHSDAAPLIALAQRISAEGACAQSHDIPKLQAKADALINERRVPPALQEPMMSGVEALSSQTPICLPNVSVAKETTTPAASKARPAPAHPHPAHPHPPHPPHPHPPHPAHPPKPKGPHK
ncbi:MAG TPA: hypothetical protein VFB25_09960 [Gaiellaceae bacterium]|nr:hypothetical protein [Gaiellaceae bacterium]